MSDLQYEEISLPLSLREKASLALSGLPIHSRTRRVRKLDPRIKEWKICEFCGLSFYRTQGSKRKYCARETCAAGVFCVRLSGPHLHRRG